MRVDVFVAVVPQMLKRFYLSPVAFFDPEGGDDKSWRPLADIHLFTEPGISHGIFETDGVTASVAVVKVEAKDHTLWRADVELDDLGGRDLDQVMNSTERDALNAKASKRSELSRDPAKAGDTMRAVLTKIARDVRATSGRSFTQPEWF